MENKWIDANANDGFNDNDVYVTRPMPNNYADAFRFKANKALFTLLILFQS